MVSMCGDAVHFFLLPRLRLCRFLLNGLGLEARTGMGDVALDSASSSVSSPSCVVLVVVSLIGE